MSPFPLALGLAPAIPDHPAPTSSPPSPCLDVTEEEGAEGMAPLACSASDIPSASFFTLWGLYLVCYVVQVRNITFFKVNIKHVVNHLQACCSGWYACRLLTSTVQTRPQRELTIQQAWPVQVCSLSQFCRYTPTLPVASCLWLAQRLVSFWKNWESNLKFPQLQTDNVIWHTAWILFFANLVVYLLPQYGQLQACKLSS